MNAKPLFVPALAVAALAAAILVPQHSRGQAAVVAAAAAADDAALTDLITEVTAQQTVILENQNKIDAKLATIAENVRVARIFVSRGGGKAR